jgi:hypothetical protein
MFNFFKKKDGEENQENSDSDEDKPKAVESTPADVTKIASELDRVKASVEGFADVRKGLTERISNLGEQVGELRAMIMDRDRSIQEVELKAIKAADLVESVQPDKLMMEVQKEDAKFEALKANLEGNESIMERVMDQLKDMRQKLEFFRGVEEVVKMSEDVKVELVEIKKVEANVHIDTDKVNTIYAELKKKFQDIDLFNDSIQEMKVKVDQNSKDSEFTKNKIGGLVSKEEMDKLVQKVQRYVDALREINKSSSLTKDVDQIKNLLESLK